jgi:hypothetical protein
MVDILPPAPNASAIIKHSAITVSNNTGSPNINIPLFALKGTKLGTNLALGYSSTGIKVDEIASRVGMGWSLQAGGELPVPYVAGQMSIPPGWHHPQLSLIIAEPIIFVTAL